MGSERPTDRRDRLIESLRRDWRASQSRLATAEELLREVLTYPLNLRRTSARIEAFLSERAA